jgi:hypothetical protein
MSAAGKAPKATLADVLGNVCLLLSLIMAIVGIMFLPQQDMEAELHNTRWIWFSLRLSGPAFAILSLVLMWRNSPALLRLLLIAIVLMLTVTMGAIAFAELSRSTGTSHPE